MRIDVHAHYYPTSYIKRIEQLGGDISPVARVTFADEDKKSLDARLQMMDTAGVDMQVLSVSASQPYFDHPRDSADAARQVNDLYAELVERYPKRFKAFVAVPLPHIDEALKELERGLDQLKMAGATVGTSVMTRSAVEEDFDPFYAELDRRGAVLFVHPAGLGLCSPLIRNFGLTWPIGAPFEDTMFAMHVIRRRIPERFPKIKIIVPHLGGAIPMLMRRLDVTQPMFAADSAERPSATARKLWYDTVAQDNAIALRCACEAFGADRLVYGSDYPYQTGDMYTRSVKYVQENLKKDDADRILDRNAAALLGLGK